MGNLINVYLVSSKKKLIGSPNFLLRWREHCFHPLLIHCWSNFWAPCQIWSSSILLKMLRWCTATSASIFAQKSVSWANYPYGYRKCALKSWNAPQLAPAPGFWRVEIQTSAKIWKLADKYFFQKNHQFVTIWSTDPQEISMKPYWQYISGKGFKIPLACQIQKKWAFGREKRSWHFLFHGWMNANIHDNQNCYKAIPLIINQSSINNQSILNHSIINQSSINHQSPINQQSIINQLSINPQSIINHSSINRSIIS